MQIVVDSVVEELSGDWLRRHAALVPHSTVRMPLPIVEGHPGGSVLHAYFQAAGASMRDLASSPMRVHATGNLDATDYRPGAAAIGPRFVAGSGGGARLGRLAGSGAASARTRPGAFSSIRTAPPSAPVSTVVSLSPNLSARAAAPLGGGSAGSRAGSAMRRRGDAPPPASASSSLAAWRTSTARYEGGAKSLPADSRRSASAFRR
jgi:hypothetical protein